MRYWNPLPIESWNANDLPPVHTDNDSKGEVELLYSHGWEDGGKRLRTRKGRKISPFSQALQLTSVCSESGEKLRMPQIDIFWMHAMVAVTKLDVRWEVARSRVAGAGVSLLLRRWGAELKKKNA